MKKFFSVRLLIAACFFALACSACASEMERDAAQVAERAMEYEQAKARFGDRSNLHGKPLTRKELNDMKKEYKEFRDQMMDKYSETPEMKSEFETLVFKKMAELQ
ncbi:MAG: hypothetical protein J6X59_06095 [Bacteroidales bacterium]|nr:hypothetical protein [Bacteroidales bacterium]